MPFTGKTPVKDGFYKIVNPANGFVLTATQEGGRPGLKHVITDAWNGSETQKWKVKTLPEGLQIIRNEEIKNNEVSKVEEEDDAPTQGESKLKMVGWNLMAKEDGLYEVSNGFGCLHGFGKSSRVTIVEECETPQTWKFVFLGEIPKPQ